MRSAATNAIVIQRPDQALPMSRAGSRITNSSHERSKMKHATTGSAGTDGLAKYRMRTSSPTRHGEAVKAKPARYASSPENHGMPRRSSHIQRA
jgi:hypothetical protein